jgi:transcription elongation factor
VQPLVIGAGVSAVVVPIHFRQGGAVKSSIIRALLTLTATGAIVAGYAGMPAASATPAVSSTSPTPLWVSVTCGPNYESPQTCVAQASGGSGTGYVFTWESGKVTSEQGGTSEATVECPDIYSYTYESVSVTDSNNGYDYTQAQIWCSPW